MRGFSDLHPAVITVFFLAAAGISMFSMEPLTLSFSFIGALLLFIVKKCSAKAHVFFALTLIVSAVINPLVYHNGATVLLVINDSPITLEALIYGVCAGVMIVSAMYWFASFTKIMTSDKLLCVLSGLSPKLSLVISMALRFVPLFSRQSKKITDAQRAVGMYKDGNAVDSMKGGLRVFSVMTTWALENGIVTADSMTARGYGMGKRSRYPKFRFRALDAFVLFIIISLAALKVISLIFGSAEVTFYPEIKFPERTLIDEIGTASYALLVSLPIIIEAKEAVKWRYLKSKI